MYRDYLKAEIHTDADEDGLFEDTYVNALEEALFAHPDIFEALSKEKQEILFDKVTDNMEIKLNSGLGTGYETAFFDVAEAAGLNDRCDIQYEKICRSSITEENLNQGRVASTKSVSTVKTPKGTAVTVYIYPYYGEKWAEDYNVYYVNHYPKATLLQNSDNRYNCHEYAWDNGPVRCWMNNPEAYFMDGSYSYIGSEPVHGRQVVLWMNTSLTGESRYVHSGQAYNYGTLFIRSKWGNGPLMLHEIDYCPYEGTNYIIRFFKKS